MFTDEAVKQQYEDYYRSIEAYLEQYFKDNPNVKHADLMFVSGAYSDELRSKAIKEFLLTYDILGKPQGLLDQRILIKKTDAPY